MLVIITSAIHAAKNQTKAVQWSSGFRANNLIVAIFTVVQIPPAEKKGYKGKTMTSQQRTSRND